MILSYIFYADGKVAIGLEGFLLNLSSFYATVICAFGNVILDRSSLNVLCKISEKMSERYTFYW